MFPQPHTRAEPTSDVSSTDSSSRLSSRLPYEARSALIRAWLAVLSARHPHVVWLPADHRQGTTQATDDIPELPR